MKFERMCSYEGPYHAVLVMVSESNVCLTEAGEQQINWVPEND